MNKSSKKMEDKSNHYNELSSKQRSPQTVVKSSIFYKHHDYQRTTTTIKWCSITQRNLHLWIWIISMETRLRQQQPVHCTSSRLRAKILAKQCSSQRKQRKARSMFDLGSCWRKQIVGVLFTMSKVTRTWRKYTIICSWESKVSDVTISRSYQ